MNVSLTIIEDDLAGEHVCALLQLQLNEMNQWSPACKIHAMPVEHLREPVVTFYAAWEGEQLAARGALKHHNANRGELKSMRAAPEFRGKGAGEAILRHLLQVAEERGYTWLGLETGRPEPVVPPQRLYQKHGFAECEPLGDYVSDEFSLCMSKAL